MSQLEDAKILLGIKDDQQDQLLSVIEKQTERHLKSFGGFLEIPSELSFVVTEVMIKRFNRIGSEGIKRKSVEGHSEEHFDTSDFLEYQGIIEDVKNQLNGLTGNPVVRFL